MKILKIKLKPLDAYFFGAERNARFSNSPVQLAQRNPYFIRSNELPAQSALFGALRFLGIARPNASMTLETSDKENIGSRSYSLLEPATADHGRIRSISPLFLTCADGERDLHYLPAPLSRLAVTLDAHGEADYAPFSSYARVKTLTNERWLPAEYDEKKAFDDVADHLCLETGKLRGGLFSSQIRTGINRQSQKSRRANPEDTEDASTPNGYFKKEYVLLHEAFSFLFYAVVEDGFVCHTRPIFMGQGRTPFAVSVETIDEMPRLILAQPIFPETANAGTSELAGLYLASDMYSGGRLSELQQQCDLMLAQPRDHRPFQTNYGNALNHKRYEKNSKALHLIRAGSVFLFFGSRAGEKAANFREKLETRRDCVHARRAGFNHWIDSEGNATWSITHDKEA